VAVSKAGILDFLHMYPSLIVSAQEKVVDAKKRVIDTDLVLLPIAESAVNILRIQHDEYHRLLGHFSELQNQDIQYALDFLKSYTPQWSEARSRELLAKHHFKGVTSSLARKNMVEDFRKRFVESKVKREALEKKAFAMGLRYANHR
jgi:hypothetical protein